MPVRILWLIKGLGPGGAEMLLINQARARNQQMVDIHAAYLVPWKNHLVTDLQELGVAVHALEGPNEWDPRWLIRLRRVIVQNNIEVVHVHSPYVAALTRLMVRTIPRGLRPGLVTTEHNRWPRHGKATRVANRLTLGLDDFTIAVSDDVRSTMPERHRNRIEVILHGVDLAQIRSFADQRAAIREELNFGDDEIVICIVANFRREKAYEVLIESAVSALAKSDKLRFVAVGQGPLEAEMRQLVRDKGISERFSILGYREDPAAVIAASDIFTLSSRHEGLPVSIMEALALAKPVVATDVGGIPQAITNGESGVLVPADSPQLLAAAYLNLATDPKLRATMARAAGQAGDRFGITPAQRRLEEIYLYLADKRRAPSNRS